MAWNFRKSFGIGPVKTTISKNGVGNSIGFMGFRIGINSSGKKYLSFGIKGTGIYFTKNLK